MMQSMKPLYKRILLKLSGEALAGERGYGQDPAILNKLAEEIGVVHKMGVQICLVIGGGNIFRGLAGASQGVERVTGDYMGMLATVINALALQNAFERKGLPTRVLSALSMPVVCESYTQHGALHHLKKGRIVIFAAGSGNPFFTTDTAATLRATEMGCNVVMKGTQVDGVYSADPYKDPNAVRYESLEYAEVLSKNLKVMDATAIALAQENAIPIVVFSIHMPHSFQEVVCGKGTCTWVGPKK